MAGDITRDRTLPIHDLQDVPGARRFVADRLGGSADDEFVGLAVLVTTELVTNALLHGRPPVSLQVSTTTAGVARVEVADGSPLFPERGDAGEDEMTGRGLSLVEALGRQWGTERSGEGKVVWCEIGDGAESVPSPATPGRSGETVRAPEPQRGTRRRGDDISMHVDGVPADLLLAAEAHVDDLVRDLTLAESSATAGRRHRIPADVVQRVVTATRSVEELRRAFRRQGQEARAAGTDELALGVTVSPGTIAHLEEYLGALDETDAYCRATRLLTMEAPPQHRILRRWVVDQLRRPSPATPGESLRDRLLAELGALAVVQRRTARTSRLFRVATGLIDARTPAQVAGVILTEGRAALGAARGTLMRVEGRQLRLAGSLDMSADALAHTDLMPLDEAFPTAEAARSGAVVWVESRVERDRRYPKMQLADPASRAVVALPLKVGDQTLGVLRFGFDDDLVIDDDEREFVRGLAAQAAAALDRALVHAAERSAREQAEASTRRLARLQEFTTALGGTVDAAGVAEVVLGPALEGLATRGAALCLLDVPTPAAALAPEQRVRVVRQLGMAATAGDGWSDVPLAAATPISDAIRQNRTVRWDSSADAAVRYPHLSGSALTGRGAIVLPLSAADRRIGALVVGLDEQVSGGPPDSRDVAFLDSLAHACAVALDRCAAVRDVQVAGRRLWFLAEASMVLSSSLEYWRTLAQVAELAVPVLADWCVVAVAVDGALQPLALTHADPAKVDLARRIQEQFPAQASEAATRVLRSGRAELFSDVDGPPPEDDDYHRLLRELGPMSSAMLVPMPARGRTLGVMTLVSSSPERRFGPADLSLAEDLGRRAGLAVDNAALFREAAGRP